jgi:hypothetical protein
VRRALVGLSLVLLVAGGAAIHDSAPANGGQLALQKPCARGSVSAVISHKRVCLRAGQRCSPGLASQYRTYGWRCPLTGRLERIPPSAGTTIAEIRGAFGGRIAAGEGAIWYLNGDLLRIDPQTNEIVDRVQLPHTDPGQAVSGLTGVAAGEGGVWVSLPARDELWRIDPSTDAIVAKIPVGHAPAGIALTPGAVWVANRFGRSVSRIDARTNTVVATIALAPTLGDGPSSIAAGAGAVWVLDPTLGDVVRINPGTDEIEAVIPVGAQLNFGALNGIAADAAAGVWVASGDLKRIDPATNRVVATVSTRALPVGVAIGLGSVWETGRLGWASGLLCRVDPATNRVIGESGAASYADLAAGFGSIWVQGGGLLRLRPR